MSTESGTSKPAISKPKDKWLTINDYPFDLPPLDSGNGNNKSVGTSCNEEEEEDAKPRAKETGQNNSLNLLIQADIDELNDKEEQENID